MPFSEFVADRNREGTNRRNPDVQGKLAIRQVVYNTIFKRPERPDNTPGSTALVGSSVAATMQVCIILGTNSYK